MAADDQIPPPSALKTVFSIYHLQIIFFPKL